MCSSNRIVPSSASAAVVWTSRPHGKFNLVWSRGIAVFAWGLFALMLALTGLYLWKTSIGLSLFGALLSVIMASIAVVNTKALTRAGEKRVCIDLEAECLIFDNVRIWRGFSIPWRPRAVAVPFAEVVYVEWSRGRRGGPDWLTITTKRGRAYLSSHCHDLGELRDTLRAVTAGASPPISDSHYLPAIIAGVIVAAALFVGFARGWLP